MTAKKTQLDRQSRMVRVHIVLSSSAATEPSDVFGPVNCAMLVQQHGKALARASTEMALEYCMAGAMMDAQARAAAATGAAAASEAAAAGQQ